jgi:hypothetical protein
VIAAAGGAEVVDGEPEVLCVDGVADEPPVAAPADPEGAASV